MQRRGGPGSHQRAGDRRCRPGQRHRASGSAPYEACKFWAADLPSGFTAALFISGLDVGKAAADVLWEHVVNGAELPATTIAQTTMVDPTNYASILDPVSLANCSA